MSTASRTLIGLAFVVGAAHLGCGRGGPLPTGGTESAELLRAMDGPVGAFQTANSPPTLELRTQPPWAPADPLPIVSGRAPLEVRFNLCRSSDPDQAPDPTSSEGDSLNWQFHFGDDGSSPWNPDGTFHANVGHMCRTSHTYDSPGKYTATVSVTDKHLEDQGGDVARLARVTQQLTIDVGRADAGPSGGGGATFCSSPGLAIPDNGGPPGVSDTLSASGRRLSDLNVSIVATHTFVGDLIFTLKHVSTGTSVTVFDRPGVPAGTFGCGGNNINTVLDDAAASPVENVCLAADPTIDAGPYAPNNPLAAFNGESLSGNWTLFVSDNAGLDTGTLDQWCIIGTF